jgi:hypothetical protein
VPGRRYAGCAAPSKDGQERLDISCASCLCVLWGQGVIGQPCALELDVRPVAGGSTFTKRSCSVRCALDLVSAGWDHLASVARLRDPDVQPLVALAIAALKIQTGGSFEPPVRVRPSSTGMVEFSTHQFFTCD